MTHHIDHRSDAGEAGPCGLRKWFDGRILIGFLVLSLGNSLLGCSNDNQGTPRSESDQATHDLSSDGATPIPEHDVEHRHLKPTVQPQGCIPKVLPDKKFAFLLGGQSNAVGLNENILLQNMQKALTGIVPKSNITIRKHAQGATTLARDWKPDGTASMVTDGAVYQSFQNALLKEFRTKDANPTVPSGMFWMQGEGDCVQNVNAKAYRDNLLRFISDVRLTFAAGMMPFVMGRLSTKQTHLLRPELIAQFKIVRAAQDAVAKSMDQVKAVDIDDAEVSSDHLHFTPAGYKKMASLFAESMKLALFPELERGLNFCK